MEELLKQMEAQAKKDVAALLKNQIGLAFEAAALIGAGKLKEAIPGEIDDAVINMVAPELIKLIKAEMLAQVAKLEA